MESTNYTALLGSDGALGAGPAVALSLSENEGLPHLLEDPISTDGVQMAGAWYLGGQDELARLAFYRRVSSPTTPNEG